jgi:hypothetical protein
MRGDFHEHEQEERNALLSLCLTASASRTAGCGEFGDVGSHTLGNIRKVRGKLDLPNMTALVWPRSKTAA